MKKSGTITESQWYIVAALIRLLEEDSPPPKKKRKESRSDYKKRFSAREQLRKLVKKLGRVGCNHNLTPGQSWGEVRYSFSEEKLPRSVGAASRTASFQVPFALLKDSLKVDVTLRGWGHYPFGMGEMYYWHTAWYADSVTIRFYPTKEQGEFFSGFDREYDL